MTATGEFTPEAQVEPTYPKVFGITLTPAVSGVLIALLGLGAALYLGMKFVAPAYSRQQELKTSVETKQADLAQKQETIRRINEITARLETAKAVNAEVRVLFPTQRTLDTLLLDLNRLIVQSNARFVTFTPDFATSGPITDGSLGPELNGKLKRQVTTVAFDGTYNQTLAIMRNVERLQTLLVVKDFSAALPEEDDQANQPRNRARTSFKLHAYVPLTPEEAAAAAQAAQAASQPSQ